MKTIFIAVLFTLCLIAADTTTKLSTEDQLKITREQAKYFGAVASEQLAYKDYIEKGKASAEQLSKMQAAVDTVKKQKKCDYIQKDPDSDDLLCVVKEKKPEAKGK